MQRSLVLLLELGSDEGFFVAREAGRDAGKRAKAMENKKSKIFHI